MTHWKTSEMRILWEHYPRLGSAGTAKLLPNRTPRAIREMARRYSIRKAKCQLKH